MLDGRIVQAQRGSALLIEQVVAERWVWSGEARPIDVLLGNLCLVSGIGPARSARLAGEGFRTVPDLVRHARWAREARRVLAAIEHGDVRSLRRRGAGDRELLALFSPEELVFLDIETTGLSSVRPLFLVGLLSVRQERDLCLRQYFARSFGEEGALLELVAQELSAHRVILTYNGHTFDVPYLQGRFNVHGIPARLPHLHVDLLPHVRRRVGRYLPDCRLTTVERRLTGRARQEDVPSHLIPELYYRYLRTGDPRHVAGVLAHNAQDLRTLPRMLELL